MNRRNAVFVAVMLLGLAADQASKWWVVQNIELHRGEIVLIPGFLSLVHAQNTGAVMGVFGDFAYRNALFALFTIIAIGVILDLVRKAEPDSWFLPATFGLLMSGALGNAVDRVMQQYVTDFIRVYTENPWLAEKLRNTVGMAEWPSFNIADSALVVGVILYIIHHTFFEDRGDDEESEAPEPEPTG